ncbi:hypothetical protein KQ306_01355 [Synechococcus sp. CS-1324]|uniref:hypothetical protein n=1 Tax=Synechococcus sp. CS-1324 TaxID=2847980 RepID=UPI00223A9ECE|nr:hypothetical protein [Synechococcus sp. CS-1324]MCT0229510.1 hypothetical protein [Synechococcus sp. CS-1324]
MLPRQHGSVGTVAGYALLLYALYSLAFLFYGSKANQPAEMLGRVNSLVGLFPPLLISFALIFQNAERRPFKPVGFVEGSLRQAVLLLGIIYLLAAPAALFLGRNQITLNQNRLGIAAEQFQERKQEIMRSVQGLKRREEFLIALQSFPEISNVVITPGEQADVVINGINQGLDKGIEARLQALTAEQQQKSAAIKAQARVAMLGSLIAGFSFLAMASRLLPWLGRSLNNLSTSLRRFWNGLSPSRKPPRAARAGSPPQKIKPFSQISQGSTLVRPTGQPGLIRSLRRAIRTFTGGVSQIWIRLQRQPQNRRNQTRQNRPKRPHSRPSKRI